jgi:hypothetical protein
MAAGKFPTATGKVAGAYCAKPRPDGSAAHGGRMHGRCGRGNLRRWMGHRVCRS